MRSRLVSRAGRVDERQMAVPVERKEVGEGGIAGFAKGGANVRLSDAEGGGTKLSYDVDAQVGGKIAQLGSRLIDSTAKKLAEEFFTNFAGALGGKA